MIEDIIKKLDKWFTIKEVCPFKSKKDKCLIGKYKGNRCVYDIHYESCVIYQINK